MTGRVALGPALSPPSPPNVREESDIRARGPAANALSAQTSPGRRVVPVDRSKADPQIRQAAEGMEAMFMDYMMKVMRQSVPKEEMDLESPATDVYRGMLDSEYAQKAVKAGGVGLTDQIIAYLESQRYNPRQAHAAPTAPRSASTGGTHEGESTR